MKTNYALRMAVFCLLGTAAHGTMAATKWGTPATFASETGTITAGTALTIGDVTNIPIITSKNILNTTFYYVKLTLTGGATFKSDVDGTTVTTEKLICDYDGNGAFNDAVDSVPLVQVPGQNKSEVTYQLSSGTLVAGATCKLEGLAVYLNSGQKEYGLQAFVNYNTVEGSTTSTNSMSLVTFAQALSVKAETVNGNGKVTVDVRSPSLGKGFANGVAADYTAVMPIGKISYANASNVNTLLGAAAKPSDYLSKFSVTVSGLPVAAAAEIAGQVRSGALFLGVDEDCTGYFSGATPTDVSFPLDATKAIAVDSGSVTLDIAVAASLDLLNTPASYPVICMVANGLTSLPKGTVKFSVVSTPISGMTPNTTTVSNELSTFVKNGASIKVLNIPGPTNATDAAFIRIYNMSDAEATVYGTLYNQGVTDTTGVDTNGGTVLGTENMVLGKVPARGVLVISPAPANSSTINLATLAGASWEGKAWMQVESDVQQLRIQALIRTGGMGGVTVNASDRVKADGECIVRSDESC